MGLGVQEVHGRAKERLVGCECPCVLPRPLIAAVDVFRCEWRDQFGPEINLKSLFHIFEAFHQTTVFDFLQMNVEAMVQQNECFYPGRFYGIQSQG